MTTPSPTPWTTLAAEWATMVLLAAAIAAAALLLA